MTLKSRCPHGNTPEMGCVLCWPKEPGKAPDIQAIQGKLERLYSGRAVAGLERDVAALLEHIEGLEAHVALLKASLKQATKAEERVRVLEEALGGMIRLWDKYGPGTVYALNGGRTTLDKAHAALSAPTEEKET